MGLFNWFSGRKAEDNPPTETDADMPWDRHPSIYEHIKAHVQEGKAGLCEGGDTLPDEEQMATGKIRWAAGAMDGVLSHHVGSSETNEEAAEILKLVLAYCGTPTAKNKKDVYDFLLSHSTLGFVDPLFESLQKEKSLNSSRLYELAKSLAIESPDREPVKFGVATLGVFRRPEDRDLFLTLGRHDEFTLFAAVALTNSSGEPEDGLWKLAQIVDGWGRIQTVERLASTTTPQIMDWLLREGYKNSVMYEYLAYTCAVTGGLKNALEREVVDDELLVSSGDIIKALIVGGPAQNIDDYDDGASVAESFLTLTLERPLVISQLLSVRTIRTFLEDDGNWTTRSQQGWTDDRRKAMADLCSQIIARPVWTEKVTEGLNSSDKLVFFEASEAATEVGIDAFPYYWSRLQTDPIDSVLWFHVMQKCPAERIDVITAFAEQHLPLDQIQSGPADEMGLGPEFSAHQCLDFIVQELARFPGHGFRLIDAALRSPVVRGRNMAIRALSEWGKESWPPAAKDSLERAMAAEPDDDVRLRMQNALAGKPLEEGMTDERAE